MNKTTTITYNHFVETLKRWKHKLIARPTEQNASDALDYLDNIGSTINVGDVGNIIYDSGITDKESVLYDMKQLLNDDEDEPNKSDAENDKHAIKDIKSSSCNWFNEEPPFEPISASNAKDVITRTLNNIN